MPQIHVAARPNPAAQAATPVASATPQTSIGYHALRRTIRVDLHQSHADAEGGKQFDTEMPAFKDTLKREEIWKVIAYMRAGFPDNAKSPRGK